MRNTRSPVFTQPQASHKHCHGSQSSKMSSENNRVRQHVTDTGRQPGVTGLPPPSSPAEAWIAERETGGLERWTLCAKTPQAKHPVPGCALVAQISWVIPTPFHWILGPLHKGVIHQEKTICLGERAGQALQGKAKFLGRAGICNCWGHTHTDLLTLRGPAAEGLVHPLLTHSQIFRDLPKPQVVGASAGVPTWPHTWAGCRVCANFPPYPTPIPSPSFVHSCL